ncbi:hypothetical protein [Exiguobacterium sp. s130]|uniref:hypothetical protein n=1 Tax=Exiguobacterium sp. s130 TaxID=2751190 RepID=UPI001BE95514|nr:hypothetical protein [Exiguobacterium sp. s130]
MNTLLIIACGIGIALIVMLAFVATLFILQRKAFNKAVEESDREWEERRQEFNQKVQEMNEHYEQRVKKMKEERMEHFFGVGYDRESRR